MWYGQERLTFKGWVPKSTRYRHMARYAFAAKYVRGKYVVDAACGEGFGTELFAKAGARRIEAFDISQEAVCLAQKTCRFKNVHFHISDVLHMPLNDRSADIFISLETIEHIHEAAIFLKEVIRVLKPDGLFICSTPNRKLTNPGISITDKPWNRFHVREYTKEEFVEILHAVFHQVQLYGQDPYSKRRTKVMEIFQKMLGCFGAVWFNRVLKTPSLVFGKPEDYVVSPAENGRDYEYLTALCAKPRQTII